MNEIRPLRRHWGENLRERRELMGMTQTALADACGVEQSTISRIERGEFAPSIRLQLSLGRALKQSPRTLFPVVDLPEAS